MWWPVWPGPSPILEETATSCLAPEMRLFFCGTGVEGTTSSGTTPTTVSAWNVKNLYGSSSSCMWFVVTLLCPPGDYPAPRAVLTGHDHEVVCVSVCAELGLVISGAKGEMKKISCINKCQQWHTLSCLQRAHVWFTPSPGICFVPWRGRSCVCGPGSSQCPARATASFTMRGDASATLALTENFWHKWRSTIPQGWGFRTHVNKWRWSYIYINIFVTYVTYISKQWYVGWTSAALFCLQAVLLSSDGQNLVTGGDNGVVEVWQACDFKQLYIYPGCDAGIRAMDLSHDQR